MIRRHFLGGMAATAGTIAGGAAGLARGPFKIGIMMHEKEDRPIDQTDPGYDLIEIPVKILVLPLGHQQQWDETLAKLRSWHLPPITISSHFLEGVLPVIGPVVDFELAEFWVERALRRISAIGVRIAGVYGGFFRPPADFPREQAMDQAVRLCLMMADHAQRYGVTIALEPMADPTTLFPRYLDAVEFARRLGRPEIRLLADTAYFEKMDQPLEDIAKFPEYCAHVQTRGDKGQPGVGDKLAYHTRLFRILRQINYEGAVSVASPWVSTTGGPMNYRVETGKSLKYLRDLRDKIYAE